METKVVTTMYPMLTAPMRPADFEPPSVAAPDTMETATSGTTSILMSWMKRVPSGANRLAAGPMAAPTVMPSSMAANIQKPKLRMSFFIYRSGFRVRVRRA